MKLISVSRHPEAASVLWKLLQERDESVNISHREMPTWESHVAFIESHPYDAWHLLEVEANIVGSVYLTKQNEIGVFVLKAHHGHGYGRQAVALIMMLYPRDRYLANINPRNSRSIAMFEGLGFHHLQNTYELSKGKPR